jgi:predicted MFS family arabinose efflux permease
LNLTDELQAAENVNPEPPGVAGTVVPIDAAVEASAPAKGLPPLWKNRDYMLLWSGQTVSALGSNISGIVLPLLILAITNSPGAAGIAQALFSLPYLIFSLPVGALIDRWDRKRVMILCDVGRAVSLASVPVAMILGVLTIWQLYVNAFIEGTLFVFFNIAEVAALSRVVPKNQLPAATAQNEIAFGTANLVGPPLGTTIYQALGQMFPFLLDSVSYIASVISLFFMKTQFQGERKAQQRNLTAEIKEGLAWLWRQKLIRAMAFVTGGVNLANSGTILIVIVLAKSLGASDASIGPIISVASIGAIIGSLVGGRIQKRFTFAQVVITLLWVEAILYPLFAVAPNVLVIGVIFGLGWLTVPIYNVVVFSYRVALIPDELQGRVNSSARLIAWGTQPLGAFAAGQLLEHFGVVPAVLSFGAVLVLCAVALTLNGHVRNAKPLEELAAEG